MMKFNNIYALLLTIVIVALWILDGRGIISLSGTILGVTITIITLVVQYYFRKKSGGD